MIVPNELNISRTRNGNSGKKRAHWEFRMPFSNLLLGVVVDGLLQS
jgi:hypothetical protein